MIDYITKTPKLVSLIIESAARELNSDGEYLAADITVVLFRRMIALSSFPIDVSLTRTINGYSKSYNLTTKDGKVVTISHCNKRVSFYKHEQHFPITISDEDIFNIVNTLHKLAYFIKHPEVFHMLFPTSIDIDVRNYIYYPGRKISSILSIEYDYAFISGLLPSAIRTIKQHYPKTNLNESLTILSSYIPSDRATPNIKMLNSVIGGSNYNTWNTIPVEYLEELDVLREELGIKLLPMSNSVGTIGSSLIGGAVHIKDLYYALNGAKSNYVGYKLEVDPVLKDCNMLDAAKQVLTITGTNTKSILKLHMFSYALTAFKDLFDYLYINKDYKTIAVTLPMYIAHTMLFREPFYNTNVFNKDEIAIMTRNNINGDPLREPKLVKYLINTVVDKMTYEEGYGYSDVMVMELDNPSKQYWVNSWLLEPFKPVYTTIDYQSSNVRSIRSIE